VRGNNGIRKAALSVDGKEFSLVVLSGLANARKILEEIKSGKAHYDLVEVMACPGGCIGGAGQPVSNNHSAVKEKRTKGIYENDRMLELHKSQENPYIEELYIDHLGEVGGHRAHELLHTGYRSRKRIVDEDLAFYETGTDNLEVNVCFGTSCFLKGSQKVLQGVLDYLRANELEDRVNVSASFCFEQCDRGPTVKIGDRVIEKCTIQQAIETIAASVPASKEP
jgi:NADH-quinone oxidoreductase subunit G